MPSELTNAPATFQSTLNVLLQPSLRINNVIWLTLLISSTTLDDHIQHLKIVLQWSQDDITSLRYPAIVYFVKIFFDYTRLIASVADVHQIQAKSK